MNLFSSFEQNFDDSSLLDEAHPGPPDLQRLYYEPASLKPKKKLSSMERFIHGHWFGSQKYRERISSTLHKYV